jgi:hypothetical protein
MAVGRDRHQGLGAVLSQNERIRQESRSSGTVPLNSPRLLIRLRMCRKSGTVPLNSPRLLIRHWIPSTGLHTHIPTKLQEEAISRPTRTDYAIQNHQVLPDQGQHDLYGRRKSGRLTRPTTIKPRRHQQAQ